MTIRSSAAGSAVDPQSLLLDANGATGAFSPYARVCAEPERRTAVSVRNPAFGSFSSAILRSHTEGTVPRDISTALSYGLELVSYGAMLVAADGQPRFANRAALVMLEKKDAVSLEKTGLIATRASDTRLLLNMVQAAIESPEQGEPTDSPIPLPRKNVQSALIVRVIPGPRFDSLSRADNRTALLMLYDQETTLDINSQILSKLYGLTRGEAALAASLVRGKTLEGAANELCISPHTARTHLKRIFMKTDTHRQSELLLRMFPAALAAGQV
jgi:DNA-binding CsgD family transcriptional regulator